MTYETPEVTYFSAESLNSITVTMSGDGGGSGGFPEGSINNPKKISNDELVEVTAAEYWFERKIYGAVDFRVITSGSTAVIKIYITALPNLYYSTESTGDFQHTASNHAVNTGYIRYIVHVKRSQSGSVKCMIKQHVDTHLPYESITWVCHSGSGRPSPTKLYFACIYLSRPLVYRLNGMILYTDFVNFHTTELKASYSVLKLALSMLTGELIQSIPSETLLEALEYILPAAGEVIDKFDPIQDKDSFLQSLWNAADMTEEKIDVRTGKPLFATGVCIKIWAQSQSGSVSATGPKQYDFESWNPGDTVLGIPGYTGNWVEYNADTVGQMIENETW